jgi:hypothetical protein
MPWWVVVGARVLYQASQVEVVRQAVQTLGKHQHIVSVIIQGLGYLRNIACTEDTAVCECTLLL